MASHRLVAALLLALFANSPAQARPEDRDLGTIPTSGLAAESTIPDRSVLVLREMACGDEARFISRFAGLRDYVPDKPGAHPDLPIGYLIAKTAALGGRVPDRTCHNTQDIDPADRANELAPPNAVTPALAAETVPGLTAREFWLSYRDLTAKLDQDALAGIYAPVDALARAHMLAQNMQAEINAEEKKLGESCDGMVHEVTVTQQDGHFQYHADIIMGPACLEQQVANTINLEKFWRAGNPGTSKLPCLFGHNGIFDSADEGEWDQAVMPLTRLTFLLRKVRAAIGLSADGQKALDKLRYGLLTISGGPAQETFNIFLNCGNPNNSYGSASGRLDDDPFYDGGHKDVEGSDQGSDDSFWRHLFGWLLFLIVLAAVAALAVGLGLLALSSGQGLAMAVAALIVGAAVGIPQDLIGLVFGGIEETENHLLMENTSAYLANKMMLDDLRAAGGHDGEIKDYKDFNDDLHDWLMERLQRITRDDFAEYNAKPYNRLSVNSVLNLFDFVCDAGYVDVDLNAQSEAHCPSDDVHLTEAAAVVLDLTAAKAAIGSNQGRRFIPFRRRSESNTVYSEGMLTKTGKRNLVCHLLPPCLAPSERNGVTSPTDDILSDSDFVILALQFWTGLTMHGPNGHASASTVESMIPTATSRYRPRALILDIAIDKSVPYQQIFHHAGWERYSSGPRWLLTAGGTQTELAQGLHWPFGTLTGGLVTLPLDKSDYGAGVPTTLIVDSNRTAPDGSDDRLTDFIRFEGHSHRWPPTDDFHEPKTFNGNFCVSGSFACGFNLVIPAPLKPCMVPIGAPGKPIPGLFLMDSATCGPWNDGNAANAFFVIVYQRSCTGGVDNCPSGNLWGFLEVVDKRQRRDRDKLITEIRDNNGEFGALSSKNEDDELTYASVLNGTLIFEPTGSYVNSVNSISDLGGDEPDWPRADGVIGTRGDAHFVIRNPRTGESEEIDFSDEANPTRVPQK